MLKYDQALLSRLHEILTFNPESGEFFWKHRISLRCRLGVPAGHPNTIGYHCLGIDKKKYLAHRIAWFMHYAEMPAGYIDHINGVRNDNRISNLRNVTQSVNMQNLKSPHADSTSRMLGAHKRRNKWEASITVAGVKRRLGYFRTPDEAHAAYLEAKRLLHPGCTI